MPTINQLVRNARQPRASQRNGSRHCSVCSWTGAGGVVGGGMARTMLVH